MLRVFSLERMCGKGKEASALSSGKIKNILPTQIIFFYSVEKKKNKSFILNKY